MSGSLLSRLVERPRRFGFDAAVRVLVDDIKDCYTALGVVHNLWTPIPREFDEAAVIDGDASRVIRQGHNRLHSSRGALAFLARVELS